MRFRKLRIAWSVACGIACVLLIVLWVRSYWSCDQVLLRALQGPRMLLLRLSFRVFRFGNLQFEPFEHGGNGHHHWPYVYLAGSSLPVRASGHPHARN